ncbi:MAG: antibiotic biosynthesis monooxygenase [Anaerolineae bacterium]|nr:antibiotic biosynthesis monooxygenase [Anaerolineae bacterium]
MYASVRLTQAKPGTADQIGQRVKDDFVPLVSQIPGFIGYYVINVGGDKLATVSIFEDEKGAQASIQASYEWVNQNITEWLARPLDIMEGRVVAYKTK